MTDDSYVKTQFTVSSHLDEEQKRQIEQRRIEDQERRQAALQAITDRNNKLSELERQLREDRKRIADEEVKKRLQLQTHLTNEMKRALPESLAKQEQRIRASVEVQYGQRDAMTVENMRGEMNKAIDDQIREAQEHDRKMRAEREKADRPPWEKAREENRRDITEDRTLKRSFNRSRDREM